MAEGIHAVISADTREFELALGRSKRSSTELAAALRQAGTQAGAFKPQAQSAVTGLNKMASTTKKATGGFKLAKNSAQQLGYQLQDVAVQLQSGTSAFTVLGQQGSQLASVLGPGGAVIGAVIAISAAVGGTLFASLTRSSGALKELTERVNGLNEAIKRTKLNNLQDEVTLASEKVGELSDNLKTAKARLAQLQQGPQMAEFAAMTANAAQKVKELESSLAFETTSLDALKIKMENIQEAGFGLTDGDEAYRSLVGSLSTQEERIRASYDARNRDIIRLTQEGSAQRTELLLANERVLQEELLAIQQKAASNRGSMGGTTQKDSWLVSLELRTQAMRDAELLQMENHQIYLQAIEDTDDEHYNRRMETLRNFLGGQEGEYLHSAGALAELTRKGMGVQQATVVAGLGSIASSMAGHSKKAFEINKAAGIANAVVDGYAAAASAWRVGSMTGPLTAAAYTAASLAKTGALIQSLRGSSYSGGGGGAGGGGSGVPNVSQPQQAQPQNQIVSINLEGEVFGREQIRGLIGQINDAQDDGYTLQIR